MLTERLVELLQKKEMAYSELTIKESIELTEFLDIFFDADKKKVVMKKIDTGEGLY